MSFGANAETARVVDILEDLGTAVAIKRTHSGLTLRGLGDVVGMTASTICRIEQGTFDPRLSSVLPLLKWLFEPTQHDKEADDVFNAS